MQEETKETTTLRFKLEGFTHPTYVVVEDVPTTMSSAALTELAQLQTLTMNLTNTMVTTPTVVEKKKYVLSGKYSKSIPHKKISCASPPKELVDAYFYQIDGVVSRKKRLRVARKMGFNINTINSLSATECTWRKKFNIRR